MGLRIGTDSKYLGEIARIFKLVSRRNRKKLFLVCSAQFALSVLDLISVVLVGALGALAVNGINSQPPGSRVQEVLVFFHLNFQSFQIQIASLGIISSALMIIRTLVSYLITRKTYDFLSLKSAIATNQVFSKIISGSIESVRDKNSQETLYALNHGMNLIFLGVIATTMSVITDFALLVVLFSALLILDISVALFSFIIFGAVLALTFRTLQKRATKLGSLNTDMSISANSVIEEGMSNFRELFVTNRLNFVRQRLMSIKINQSDSTSKLTLMPYISKYIVEGTMTLGTLAVCALQFMQKDAVHAIGILSVFLAAATRMGPAAMRMQQGAIQIRGNIAQAEPTLKLIEEFENVKEVNNSPVIFSDMHVGFDPEIICKDISFTYTNSNKMSLSEINLSVPKGKHIAIVGTSGAGKSTLVDVILGVLSPSNGSVTISGLTPAAAIETWVGAIAYVPQEVLLIEDTIRGNLLLGLPSELVSDEKIHEALKFAQLDEFVRQAHHGLETKIGEGGIRISGGQRQRIGIARAVLTKPKLIILDEATSSMDGQTESDITEAIHQLKGEVTVITIAHRLSTVRWSDVVVFMRDGCIVEQGTFDYVRNAVPDFDQQAKLMGL